MQGDIHYRVASLIEGLEPSKGGVMGYTRLF